VYFETGKPRVQSTFKNGLREGKVTEWDAAGRKIAEADYVAGKLDGKLVRYAEDGTTSEEHYKAGARVQAAGAATP
jgi:antitoxin component YwqK of YwqJK toxin-antitoxin module